VGALQRSLRGDPATAAALVRVRARYRECLEALRLLGQSSDGWAFAEEAHGATTHYRHDAAGRLWLRTEGVMDDIGCLECIAMWKEVLTRTVTLTLTPTLTRSLTLTRTPSLTQTQALPLPLPLSLARPRSTSSNDGSRYASVLARSRRRGVSSCSRGLSSPCRVCPWAGATPCCRYAPRHPRSRHARVLSPLRGVL